MPGGQSISPEEYQEAQLNKNKSASDSMDFIKNAEIECGSITPWRIWKHDDFGTVEILMPIMTIRDYVEACTVHEHKVNQVSIGDLEWPITRGRTSWLNVMILTALAALSLYAISLW